MNNETKKDERTQKQNQRVTTEAYYVIMAFLLIAIITKQMFLRQPFSGYWIEFSAFALGGAYALIRSLSFGVADYSKKLMRFVPLIISAVITVVILCVNFSAYKAAHSLNALFMRASVAFAIMIAFGYAFLFIVSLINKRRAEKLTDQYK